MESLSSNHIAEQTQILPCRTMSAALSHEPLIQRLNVIPSMMNDQKKNHSTLRDSIYRVSKDAIHVTEFMEMILGPKEEEEIMLTSFDMTERDSFSTVSSAVTSGHVYSALPSRLSSAKSNGDSPNSATQITESVSGYLYKIIGSGVMKRWKRKFFMLHGSTLFSYDSNKRNDAPQEIMHLSSKATVHLMDVRGKFAFSVQTDKQSWILSGEDDEERKMWLRALDRAQIIHRYSNEMPLPKSPRDTSMHSLSSHPSNRSSISSAMSSLRKRQAELRQGLSVDTRQKPLPKIPEHLPPTSVAKESPLVEALSALDLLEERLRYLNDMPSSPFSQLQFYLHSA
jgi:hypothetical protein